MKILANGEVDIEILFPAPNKVAIRATQGDTILGYEVISDVEASYRFTNNLTPFEG